MATNEVPSGKIPDHLVRACIGNRPRNPQEPSVQPCPEKLRALLEASANPNAVDAEVGGPVLHTACWMGNEEVVRVLLEFRADMEAKDPRMKTPPLNTALAAGNAPVCLALLNANADVMWKHEDGATPLHVAMAWIASSHNSHLRLPPMGEEPRAVIAMMLHNGVDPLATEGMTKGANRSTGMTPLQVFRQEIARSPWRQDPQIGPRFDKMARVVHELLEQGEKAMTLKKQGNKAFAEERFADAVAAYAGARKIWETANIRGHHTAVLWSNEAVCHKKLAAWNQCREACEQGLTHFCTSNIRSKLENALQEANDEEAAAREKAAQVVEEQLPALDSKPRAPKAPATKLKDGFLEQDQTELYGPGGSVQGKLPNPGPYICHFEEAKEAGFVDGCDGWKDRQLKEEQELDRQLVAEGLMSPELLDDPKSLDFINRIPEGSA